MRSRTGALIPIALLLCGLATACGGAPSLSYLVAVSAPESGQAAITLELKEVPHDSLTLRAYAAKEVLRISDFTATAPDGSPLKVEPGLEAVSINNRTVDIPRFVLPGPLPLSLRVRYRISPGNREGDGHVGYTGRCYGYLGNDFALLTGRNLFLLAEPAEAIRDIDVRFTLPGPWKAITPWRREGDRWLPGLEGKFAAEHLVSAAIGLGHFRERSFKAGGTLFRLAFESGILDQQESQDARRLEQVVRFVHGLFGRDLGREYLTVVVPKAGTRDDIAGEGWATGQGETLSPLTGNRLREFAANLIEAYTRHAPYRTEIGRSEEFWLVDGIRNWYGWRAVAEAGIGTREEVARDLAVAYLSTLNVEGLERNLERIYSTPGSHRIERETLAPFTLVTLDRELRKGTGGRTNLDLVLRVLFSHRTVGSLWSALPAVLPGFWDDFRSRFVRGAEPLPAEAFYTLASTLPEPDPRAGKVVREMTLVYTGKTNGYLENCGCKVNQSGGVTRRATELERIRRADPHALLLDAGDAFLRPEKQRSLDYLSREEQGLYLQTLDLMRYDASAVNSTELTFGVEHLRKMTRGLRTPFLSANVREAGGPIAPGSILVRSGDLRIRVIGVFEPPRGEAAGALLEENILPLEIEDPVETLRREVPRLKEKSDLVVAVGRLTPFTIRRVVQACPDLGLVISTEYEAPTRVALRGRPELQGEDHSGFLGRTLILYTRLTNYGLGSARLSLDGEGRIASAKLEDLWLYDDVPDQPRVREMLNRFYDRIGREAAAQESVPPLFADDPVRVKARYIGVAKCSGCHEPEYLQWMTTPHATAYKTLLDRHRHFQPKCVSCHVVGYGTPFGYHLGAPETKLANVQCEVCHGPGADHAGNSARTNIRRAVPEKVCLECHNPEHSDHFVYAERLPKVRHEIAPETKVSSAPGAGAKAASRPGGR
ncbi:MAG TPA: multiheme c-type cytochrome [Candidatus Polarisedimenticolia bacterium]|nr:multiheme c-type cytochrome [Candidatus Polarisedimenticolia bacterium]